tara:strand:- start:71 stop:301 length:231 start_codon:yes stop_codon:yes gene_type:complete
MNDDFAKELAIRSLLKTKGYTFEPENQYWVREWTTDYEEEKILEVAMQTDDGEWNKLMMNTSGDIFYAKSIGEEVY